MNRQLNAALLACALLAAACGTRVTGDVVSTTGAAGQPAGAQSTAGDLAGRTDDGSGLSAGDTGSSSGGDAGASQGGGTDAAAAPGESGGDGQAAAAAAQGESGQGVSDTEIRIGASLTLSGVAGFLGEEIGAAIDSYFQMINARGGVNGRKLKLITYDDRGDPSQMLANVRKLWEQDKVFGLMLGFADPASDYVTRNKIPTVVFGVTPPSFSSKYPTVFPMVGNALLWTHEIIAGLQEMDVIKKDMKVAILYDTETYDLEKYVPMFKEAWELAGAKVVSTDPLNLSDNDCTSLVLKMRQLDIDYWDFQGIAWIFCASAAQRQNWKPNIGWGAWATSVGGLTDQVGPYVDGMWGGAQGDKPDGAPRQKTKAHEEYVAAITKYHPKMATELHLESPAEIGYWVAAKLFHEAIAAQGPVVTQAGVVDWISKVNAENFDPGITPPIISMAPDCKTGSEIVWVGRWRWKDGHSTRRPETGYITSPFKDRYGGKCMLTKLADA